jgi:hypothetical protein
MHGRSAAQWTGLLAGLLVLAGCPARRPIATQTPLEAPPTVKTVAPRPEGTPVPTVGPSTPVPMPTRPLPLDIKGTKDRPVGPIISHFGTAKADGTPNQPSSVGKDGVAVYTTPIGSGFMLVVEAKPGLNNHEVARSIFSRNLEDPTQQPDLQLISNRPLGDGSEKVCDRMRPEIGGIPAVSPPSFEPTKKVSNALNDMACRFETFVESESACTTTPSGEVSFVNGKESTAQFCMIVARAWAFPIGTTELQVRLRDVAGNPGPVKRMRIFRPEQKERPTRPRGPFRTPTPKPLPTR